MKTVSRKVPVAMAVGWLACVVIIYILFIVTAFCYPMQYMAFIESMLAVPWQGGVLLTSIAAVAALSVLPIFLMAKKAGVKWLEIISLVYLMTNGTMSVLLGVQLLTQLP